MKRLVAWLESLSLDLRLAVRNLRKSPDFLMVVVLSLALGIGANSTIFSVMDVLLLRPLPVRCFTDGSAHVSGGCARAHPDRLPGLLHPRAAGHEGRSDGRVAV